MSNKHGSQLAEQKIYISHDAPSDGDVVLGQPWFDPDDGKFYICTSLGPIVFTEFVGGGGAPADIDYLVGTADGDLSNEIVVGTTPGGELGNTWASPTVDSTHSGSAHHADAHTAASHSDQGATGAELEELTDASETTLHSHAGGGGLSNIVEDMSPQLGAQLDVNGFALGDGVLELLSFVETPSAVNHIEITNNDTGDSPHVGAVGDDTNITMHLHGKGTGALDISRSLPSTASQELIGIESVIDSSAQVATSEYIALLVETTGSPAGVVAALGTEGKVDPIRQGVFTPSTPSQTEFAGRKTGGGSSWVDGIDGNEIFIVDNDEIYIGAVAQFDELEVIMSTPATKNVIPTFWYNTAADTWTQFFPEDATNGFQQSAEISWLLSGISGSWTNNGDPGAGDSSAGYWIKIIRTRNADPGSPTPTTIKTGLDTIYGWDSAGIATLNTVKTDTISERTPAAGVTIDSVLLKDGAIADGAVPSTHSGSAHHTKYLDSEAIAAIEGEATLDLSGDVTIDGAKSLLVDVINEKDGASGVTIDSVLLKDGLVDGIDVAARDHAQAHTADSHSDQGATGAELETLTDGSETTLHSHAGSGAASVLVESGSESKISALTPITLPAAIDEFVVVDDPGGTPVTRKITHDDVLFGANGTPSTQAHGDSAAIGTALDAARSDHKHAMPGAGSGAPADADYLVGTANGSLSNEIVVGTTPGGELGNTWASPTVDSVHSGSSHHTKYLDSEAITAIEGEATLDLAGDVTIDGTKSLLVDVINEKDADAGVTIEGVLLKDSAIAGAAVPSTHSGSAHHTKYLDSEAIAAVEGEATLVLAGDVTIAVGKTLAVDVVAEKGAGTGVTIDSVLLKDGLVDGIDVAARDHAKYLDSEAIAAVEAELTLVLAGDVTIDGAKSLSVDVINEKDADAGVLIDSVLLKDGLVDGIDVAARDHAVYTDAEALAAGQDDATSDPLAVGDAAADGTEESFARKDHVHATGGTANGELAGSYPNPTVDSTHAGSAHHSAESSATSSAEGIVELAIASEVSTGTDAGRAITPDALAGSDVMGGRSVQMVAYDFGTDVATGDGKFYFLVGPRLAGMNLVDVRAKNITAGITNQQDVQLRNVTSGQDILSTKLVTATGQTLDDGNAVIDSAQDDMTLDDLIAVDVDAIHSGTAPKGLILELGFRLP